MNIREYANTIAKEIGGEVTEVEKTNGVRKTGITFNNGTGISPCIYIDEMFDRGVTVEQAALEVEKLTREYGNVSFDTSKITNYESVKEMMSLRLYNAASNYEVFEPATKYGFDDLIIIPVVDNVIPGSCVRVTTNLLQQWGVTKEQVFADAEANINKGDFEIKSMAATLAEMMGGNAKDFETPDGAPEMYVITNKSRTCGAYGVIALADELKTKFKDGYTVIPSSIHEVIILPGTGHEDDIKDLIGEVNETQVLKEEQLGNKPYFIAV